MKKHRQNREFAEKGEKTNWQKLMPWLRRLGTAGFIFFLAKGIIWLAVIFGLGSFFTTCT